MSLWCTLIETHSFHLFITTNMNTTFDPIANTVGGFLPNDSTVELYLRIRSVLNEDMTVLDLGAGRAEWYYDNSCNIRKDLRSIKNSCHEYICADVDDVVLNNPTSSKNVLIVDGKIPLDNNSCDIIIADYVFEHIEDVKTFVNEIRRVLKNDGYIFARTPHKYEYVAIFARFFKGSFYDFILSKSQPERKEEDMFPTVYKLNTIKTVGKLFSGFENYSYLYTSNPSYYFGSKFIYYLFVFIHKMSPKIFTSNIHVVLKK